MRCVNQCPVCGTVDRTLVAEYNGLIFLDSMRDEDLARYDYMCCHGCGLTYASRRPEGAQFAFLSEHFNEFLGRPGERAANPLDWSHALSAEERADLARRLKRGWLVSEEGEPDEEDWMPHVLNDRLSNSYHFDILSSLMPLNRARILEVRSKTGFLLDMFRRYHDAEVHALPMFDSQRVTMEELFQIRAETCVDFEQFDIPYDGPFDLIIAKHMFTHALEPKALLAKFSRYLRPGGGLYLFAENDDMRMYERRKNLFGEMKCFHFQNFDLPVLARSLRFCGFDVEFIRHPRAGQSEMSCFARKREDLRALPITNEDLESRLERYRKWRDLSISALPESAGLLFGNSTSKESRKKKGKKVRSMHAVGYQAINQNRRGASRTWSSWIASKTFSARSP